MQTSEASFAWKAVYTEGCTEAAVVQRLRRSGVPSFAPFEQTEVRRKNPNRPTYRLETVLRPLFPNYVFALTDDCSILKRTPGVLSIVSVRDGPLHIPASVVETLRLLTRPLKGLDVLRSPMKRQVAPIRFTGEVNDVVSLSDSYSFFGLVKVMSTSRVGTHGVIGVWLEMLGVERLIDVPVSAVSNIVRKDGSRIAATVSQ